MNGFFRVICAAFLVAVGAVACGDEKSDVSPVVFEDAVAYFSPSESRAVKFLTTDVVSMKVASKPDGWTVADIVVSDGYVMVTAPAASASDAGLSGTLSVNATTVKGDIRTASIFVAVSEGVDLTSQNANSYIINKSDANYLIDVMHTPDGKALSTASVEILWQSSTKLVQYLALDEGKASFYVGHDDDGGVKIGNALLGGYDAEGKLLWSWHLWIADYDPDSADGTVELNGYEMMSRNLGAIYNSNATSAEIRLSFGMYYQWGRKDPFIYPASYDAMSGSSASIYNESGTTEALKYEPSTAETGTVEYASANPMCYITGVKESGYDWMHSGSATLWGDSKTVADPCPYGWKVAPAAAFAGLEIVEPLDDAAKYNEKYGWTLTDGTAQDLFMGGGCRVYDDGKFQNVYVNPDTDYEVRNAALYSQPWVGLYWTSDAAANGASALYFYFNKAHVERSRVEGVVTRYRANAMPVRCVKM